MNKEMKAIVKKTAKIAGVTCIAAGAVALMTSATALKALTEGGKYLKDTVHKILNEQSEEEVVVNIVEEAPVVEAAEETTAAEGTEV